jgi:hypothetical protein
MLDRQCGELIALTEEKHRGQRARVDLEQGCKGCIEVAFGACMDDMSVQPKGPGGHIGAFSGTAMLVHDSAHPLRHTPECRASSAVAPRAQGADANAVRI